MNKLNKLDLWIGYLVLVRAIQVTVLFTASMLAIIKDRSDLASYFLVLSFWINSQLNPVQNRLTNRYNRLLDEQERRDKI